MKKVKIISIVALLAAVIGLAGLIVFLTPGQTKPDKIITKYVSAINAGKPDKMKECTYSLGDDFYVIGCAEDNTELRDKLNENLKKVIDSGKAAEISNKWFGKDIVVFVELED